MKRHPATKMLLALIMAISMLALTACTEPAVQAKPPQAEPAAEKPAPESAEEESPEQESSEPESHEQVFEAFKGLAEQARAVYFWYNGMATEGNEYGLAIDEAEIEYGAEYLTEEQVYRKVGKFGSVDEMKAASEEVFTKEFCETFFYGGAFAGETPLYAMRDGALCRDTMAGGTGYYSDTVLDYNIPYHDGKTIVIQAQKIAFGTDTETCDIILKNIGGKWKIDTYFDMNPHKEASGAFKVPHELVVGNAVSAGLCTLDWRDVNEIDAEKLLHFYMYSYLYNTEDLDFDFGWRVSAAKLLEGLSAHLNGVAPEAFDTVKENYYTRVYYDAATDDFSIENHGAPAKYTVLDSKKAGKITTLEIMVYDTVRVDFNIDDGPVFKEEAAYTAFLDVEVNGDGIKLFGNRRGEDFRPQA